MAPSATTESALPAIEPTPVPYYTTALRQKYGIKTLNSSAQWRDGKDAAIGFYPDMTQFTNRTIESLKREDLPSSVPDSWPAKFEGPMSWKGADFANESPFIYHLSPDELREIEAALRHFQSSQLPIDKLSASTFPLPKFAQTLAQVQYEVYNGIGCKILRGLDVDKFTDEEASIILLGVSNYIAEKVGKQDKDGRVFKHLVDWGKYDRVRDLPVHTDIVCDVVATITKESALGGQGTATPCATIYNVLADRRPDLIHVLAEPVWCFDTFGRSPPFHHRAVLYNCNRKPVFSFSRRMLTGAPTNPRSIGIPGLSERQAEALDAVHFIARDHQATMTTVKGDIRFVNNTGLLHGREPFDGHEDAEFTKRHLIRLWLHNPDMLDELPRDLQLAWDRTFTKDPERPERWNPVPVYDETGHLQDRNDPMPACD